MIDIWYLIYYYIKKKWGAQYMHLHNEPDKRIDQRNKFKKEVFL